MTWLSITLASLSVRLSQSMTLSCLSVWLCHPSLSCYPCFCLIVVLGIWGKNVIFNYISSVSSLSACLCHPSVSFYPCFCLIVLLGIWGKKCDFLTIFPVSAYWMMVENFCRIQVSVCVCDPLSVESKCLSVWPFVFLGSLFLSDRWDKHLQMKG